VAVSFEHGADAAGGASAFVDANDQKAWLSGIAEALIEKANSFDNSK
jgi:hypothetical protein